MLRCEYDFNSVFKCCCCLLSSGSLYQDQKKRKIEIKKYKIGVNYDEIKRRAKERKIKKRTC